MEIQLKRGLLDVLALAAVQEQASYGYQIMKDIAAYVSISESTLYPVLRRLEGGGQLRSYSVEHNGRLRKYYEITEEGRKRLRDFVEEWKEMMEIYQFVIGGRNHE